MNNDHENCVVRFHRFGQLLNREIMPTRKQVPSSPKKVDTDIEVLKTLDIKNELKFAKKISVEILTGQTKKAGPIDVLQLLVTPHR